jgi:hypothetical protein
MDVSGALSLRMLAYSIDTAKQNVAAVQAQPVSSPEVASDVILQLSSAAQSLLVGHPK